MKPIFLNQSPPNGFELSGLDMTYNYFLSS
jgi:hypothetical protein